MIRLKGRVYSRSTIKETSVVGEAEMHKLNPDRVEKMKALLGVPTIEPGSLNISISDENIVLPPTPDWEEHKINHPDTETYRKIAKKRLPYYYWKATCNDTPVLVRRSGVNPVKNCLELYAEKNLRSTLGLKDGDKVKIHFGAQPAKALFLDRSGNPAELGGIYNGASAFLIASGPSFNKVNKNWLRWVWTMGINNSPKAMMPYFRPNAWTCVDGADKFLHTIWRDPKVLKIAPAGHARKPLWDSDKCAGAGVKVKDCPNVVYYERNSVFNASTFLSENTFNWGNGEKTTDQNGVKGKRSVLLVALKSLFVLGFRRVYLLGVDFNMSPEAKYSFQQDRNSGSIKGNNATYQQLKWRFEQLKPHFDSAGFQVYNCNPDSALEVFPKISIEEAMEQALGFTDWPRYINGDMENTSGLYETKWFVCPDCNRERRVSKEDVKEKKVKCECGRRIRRRDRKKYLKDKEQAHHGD